MSLILGFSSQNYSNYWLMLHSAWYIYISSLSIELILKMNKISVNLVAFPKLILWFFLFLFFSVFSFLSPNQHSHLHSIIKFKNIWSWNKFRLFLQTSTTILMLQTLTLLRFVWTWTIVGIMKPIIIVCK